MAKYQCKTCLGVYVDPQPGGGRYFHACAPLHNAAFDTQFTFDAEGVPVPKGTIDPKIPPMVERPGKRDENVIVQSDGKTAPKSDGAGKDTLP